MDSERVRTGLYNRAKNYNNNSNNANPINNKTKILNVNSLNFLKDTYQDVHEDNQMLQENNTNLKIKQKLFLPNINKNNTTNISNTNNKITASNNLICSKRNISNKQNLLDNYDANLLIKQNNNFNDNNFISNTAIKSENNKRKPSAKNIIETKDKINSNKRFNEEAKQNMKHPNIFKEEKTQKAPLAARKPTVRKFKSNTIKEFLKESAIKSIQLFLDPKSLKNFILSCKKFYNYLLTNDDLWFIYYSKKYKIQRTKEKYNEHFGKWREVFLKSLKKIFDQNYDQLKNKFMKHFNKNKYQISKDPYNIANLVYHNMKPYYNIEIDDKTFPVKHIFTNKILSHINFFINFDQEYLDYRKANKIKLLLNEKNLGLSDIKIYEIEIKKKKFLNLENEEIKSKICNIYSYNEFIFSTFEKNYIFFINISLPICKICEICFDFLKGIHGKNLLYEDDISKDFGLYEYVLLLNIKSWKDIFFTLHVNKLDFKKDLDDPDYIYYENDSRSK